MLINLPFLKDRIPSERGKLCNFRPTYGITLVLIDMVDSFKGKIDISIFPAQDTIHIEKDIYISKNDTHSIAKVYILFSLFTTASLINIKSIFNVLRENKKYKTKVDGLYAIVPSSASPITITNHLLDIFNIIKDSITQEEPAGTVVKIFDQTFLSNGKIKIQELSIVSHRLKYHFEFAIECVDKTLTDHDL